MSVEVLQGDCIQLVPTLGQFDLVFADPPFNIGQDYNGYDDSRDESEFAEFTQKWIEVCWNACRGVMVLHGPIDLLEQYLIAGRRLKMRRLKTGAWLYNFGQCRWTNWIDDHCHWIAFAKNDSNTWNPEAIAVQSARVRYGDKRINDSPRGGRRPPGSIFGVPSDGPYWGRVQGTSIERVPDRPNQLPEVYLARFIKAYTNEGDRILDPFGGTGTTAVVADALDRNCVTCELTESGVETIRNRVAKGAVRIKKKLENSAP